MPDYREFHFEGPDQRRRFCRLWQPEAAPHGVVVLVHGLGEHGGRYATIAAEWAASGLAVYVPDLVGHGRSAGPRAAIRRFDLYLDEVEQLLEHAQSEHPGRRVFLIGQSMGGAVAGLVGVRRRVPLDGLVLAAPAVRIPADIFPWLRRLANAASAVMPWLRLVRIGGRRVSRDPLVVADFEQDPLVFHGRFTVRLGAEILHAAERLEANSSQLEMPLLVLHGTADRVTDPLGSRLVFSHARSTDKALRLYDGLWHDLWHEPEWRTVTDDVRVWLLDRCRQDHS
jgi:acylglycerol lipase